MCMLHQAAADCSGWSRHPLLPYTCLVTYTHLPCSDAPNDCRYQHHRPAFTTDCCQDAHVSPDTVCPPHHKIITCRIRMLLVAFTHDQNNCCPVTFSLHCDRVMHVARQGINSSCSPITKADTIPVCRYSSLHLQSVSQSSLHCSCHCQRLMITKVQRSDQGLLEPGCTPKKRSSSYHTGI